MYQHMCNSYVDKTNILEKRNDVELVNFFIEMKSQYSVGHL